jgi:hypothetical protein
MEILRKYDMEESQNTVHFLGGFTMADHDVTFTLPADRPLKRADIAFKVRIDRSIIGTLKVREGEVRWESNNGGNKNTTKMKWMEFARLMEENKHRKKRIVVAANN